MIKDDEEDKQNTIKANLKDKNQVSTKANEGKNKTALKKENVTDFSKPVVSFKTPIEYKTDDQAKIDEKNKCKRDIICNNFVMLLEMGRGTFGTIYLSYNLRENVEVAVKIEQKKSYNNTKVPQLKMEYLVLKALLGLNLPPNAKNITDYVPDYSGLKKIPHPDVQGVPHFYGYGEHYDSFYLIMQLLGPNLSDLFNFVGKRMLSVTTICLLALQIITRIENLHKNLYIHRDIKPENFLIGGGDKSNIVYLIDYGLCKKYKDKTGTHIPYRENRVLTGTARYVSINTHLGIEQSRRDDLESIGYLLVYFLKGSLPWMGIKGNAGMSDRNTKIAEKKLQIPTEILCYKLPEELSIYLNYTKNLRFEDRPDYEFLRGLFVKRMNIIISSENLQKEQINFDWCLDDKPVSSKKKTTKQLNKKKTMSSRTTPKIEECVEETTNITGNNVLNDSSDIRRYTSNVTRTRFEVNPLTTSPVKSQTRGGIAAFDDSITSEDTIRENHYVMTTQNNIPLAGKPEECIFEDDEEFEDHQDEEIDKFIDQYNIGFRENIKVSTKELSEIRLKEREEYEAKVYPAKFEEQQQKMNSDSDSENSQNPRNNFISRGHGKNEMSFHSTSNNEGGNEDKDKYLIASQVFPKNKNILERITPKEHKENKEGREVTKTSLDNSIVSNAVKNTYESLDVVIMKEPLENIYLVTSIIGEGSRCNIFKAVNKKTEEKRTIKILKKDNKNSIREITILYNLNHPNIVKVYEVYEDQKNYFLVMEYLEGTDLIDAVCTYNGKFYENEIAKVFYQLIDAVNYLHSQRIAHRDIKPDNIFMLKNSNGDDLVVKLIDFGNAIKIQPGEMLNQFVGTASFMSPEMINVEYNEKCDIWSLGIIFYILFTGAFPFKAKQKKNIYKNILYQNIEFKQEEWTHIKPQGQQLIKSMLNKDHKQRPSSEVCLANSWFKSFPKFGENTALLEVEKRSDNKIKSSKDKFKLSTLTLHSIFSRTNQKLVQFNTENKLKKAMIKYISNNKTNKHEKTALNSIFKKSGASEGGLLSYANILKLLESYYGYNEAKIIVEYIFNKFKLQKQKDFSYEKFLNALFNEKETNAEEQLRNAFRLFDADGNEKVSPNELAAIFGEVEIKWKALIDEFDANGDGELDYGEFKKLILNFEINEL